MSNIEKMMVFPVPHLNLLTFTGMGSRGEYLIWKSSTDGFFTALSKKGELETWSSVTGQRLWVENQNELSKEGYYADCCWENLRGYEIYRSNKKDCTYTRDYYNYDCATQPDKSCARTLLVSRMPVHKEQTMAAIESCDSMPTAEYEEQLENYNSSSQDMMKGK